MLLSSCLASCKDDYGKRLPKGEECVVISDGAFCVNTIDNTEYNKTNSEIYGFSCISQDRKKELESYIFNLMKQNDCYRMGGNQCQ